MIGQSPQFSVSDFVFAFNQTIEFSYPEVEIVGELSNFRISKNAWVYFDLKDEDASLKFFGSVRALPGPLEDGMTLSVIARPYLHPVFNFSMQASAVSVTGSGAINRAYLMLKNKLEKEGLFDETRKRRIPYPPDSITLITSKESAAYGDFIKIIKKRWPSLKINLIDVNVQGKDAPEHISNAFMKANQKLENDVVVLIRGGGSKDDLSSFDHEIVVRAVASSRIPTLVAIGHERDESLAELVADVRASTPSNAAEILVPEVKSELEVLNSISAQLDGYIKNYSLNISREIVEYSDRINREISRVYLSQEIYIKNVVTLVQAFDPRRPMRLGFSLARNAEGKIIASKKDALSNQDFELEFKDGKIDVKVKGK